MELEQLLNYVSNNGFAIVVAGWMILKQTKETQTLIQAVNNLTTMVEHFCGAKDN